MSGVDKIPMCKCRADRLYHDWCSVNISPDLPIRKTFTTPEQADSIQLLWTHIRCYFIWKSSKKDDEKQIKNVKRLWRSSHFSVMNDCYPFFYVSLTNGKSFISASNRNSLHFSTLYIILRERERKKNSITNLYIQSVQLLTLQTPAVSNRLKCNIVFCLRGLWEQCELQSHLISAF